MKKIIILSLLMIIVESHSRIMLIKYHTYYKLGYEYAKSIFKDTKDTKVAFNSAKEMCIDTINSPYMDSKYKGSCIYGVKDALDGKKELNLDSFLVIFNQKHNSL
jgi:ABC-type transporter MlaC component